MVKIYDTKVLKKIQGLQTEKNKIINILKQVEHLNLDLYSVEMCGKVQSNGEIYFCKKRYCPICNNGRSRRFYARIKNKIAELEQTTEYKTTKYFFITLGTIPTTADDIDNRINIINKAFNKLINNHKIKKYILGYIKAIEIKYEPNNTFNVHLHCIIAMKSTYVKGSNYLNTQKWQELWQKYLRVDYIPNVKVKTPQKEEYAKIAGYIGKGSNLSFGIEDNLLNNNINLDEDTKKDIYCYLASTYKRKFYTSTGILKI